jgi:hypothetical protein
MRRGTDLRLQRAARARFLACTLTAAWLCFGCARGGNNPPPKSTLSIAAAVAPQPNANGWNNTDVTVTFTCKESGTAVATCPPPQTISTEGANQVVNGTATDNEGNSATAKVTLNIDKTPPTVSAASSPAANLKGWNNTSVSVSFNCSDTGSGIATCPAAQTVTTEGTGQVITAAATDKAGNTATASVTLNIDEMPPVLKITSPPYGANVNLSLPAINVTGNEGDNLSGVAGITCNNSPATISGGKFSCTAVLASGSNSISVTGIDVAGNSATVPVVLTYAPAAQVAITSPANLSVTNLSPAMVNGTISDPNAGLTINGIPTSQSGGAFSTPVPLVEGLNTLSVVATNLSGVTSTANVQVTLDTTPPHITIDSPSDGTVTTDAAVAVSGLANDVVVGTVNAVDVQVSVNGMNAAVANRTYSVPSVSLALGKNTIQATAKDRAGNGTTTSITITRVLPSAPPAPAIGAAVITNALGVVSGNNQSATIGTQLASPLVTVLKDQSGNPVPNQTVIFRVTGNNGVLDATSSGAAASSAVAVTTDANGQAQAYWTLGQRSGAGINMVQASSALAFSAANFVATGLTGSPFQIVVDSGNGQTGAIGQALPFPFVVVAVDAGHNRVPGVPVTFAVTGGGGDLGGNASQTVTTDSSGRGIVVLTLGLEEGIENNLVQASFPGSTGIPVVYAATAKAPGDPTATTISGVVLDNSNNPIPGVTMRLYQTNQGNANNLPVQIGTQVKTDAQGTFLIQSAPVGAFKLMADGSTANGSKAFPTLEYDIVTVAGNDNTVGMPIYLPALDTVNKLCVDATHGGTLTLPQVPGFSLTVQANSATFPGGARQGCLSVTPVNGDKVPMAPGFGQQPRFIVTIQPVGTTFNPPASLTLPNVDGLKPKAVTEMYSYDHDLGMFVAIGTATVSDDGSVIASNPGVGVLKAGWHCGGDPNTVGVAGLCGTCQTCNGVGCVPDDTATCDDGKFCTSGDGKNPGPDECRFGVCQGVEIEDVQTKFDVGSMEINELTKNLTELENVLSGEANPTAWLPCQSQPKISLTLGADVGNFCCEADKSIVHGQQYKGGGAISGTISCFIGVSSLFPAIPPKLISAIGINGSLSAGLNGSLNKVTATCSQPLDTETVGFNLSATLSVVLLKVGDLIGAWEEGPSASITGTWTAHNFFSNIDFTGKTCIDGKIKLDFELLGYKIETDGGELFPKTCF